MNTLFRTMTVFSAVILSGCVGGILETTPPKPRYMVGFVDAGAVAGEAVDWSLIIENPGASRAYDTTKIAVSPSPGRIEYFGDGEWASRAPVVVQMAMIQAFEDSGRILAVGNRADIGLSDLALQTDIRRLDLDVSGGGRNARIDVYVRLTNGRSKVVAARAFSGSATARSSGGDDVAAAFDTALKGVVGEIVNWAFDEGESARSTS